MIIRWLIRRRDEAADRWLAASSWRSLDSDALRRTGRRREQRAYRRVIAWDITMTHFARRRRR